MNPAFALIPVILMFTLIPAINAAFIKLSERILRYQGISWNQGFVFGIIVVICNAMTRAAFSYFEYVALVPGVLVGLFANWLIGSWYFSGRTVKFDGGTLGWTRALKLTGLAVLMLGITATILIAVPKMFVQRNMP